MSRKPTLADVLLCCWILAAQVWYYSRFKDQFAALFHSVASRFVRAPWH